MASEASRKKAAEIVKASVMEHDEDCGRLATPTYSGQCDCGFEVLADEIAAALDEARAEGLAEGLTKGAERERWECHRIADSWAARFEARGQDEGDVAAGKVAVSIAARGPMRGPEEE